MLILLEKSIEPMECKVDPEFEDHEKISWNYRAICQID